MHISEEFSLKCSKSRLTFVRNGREAFHITIFDLEELLSIVYKFINNCATAPRSTVVNSHVLNENISMQFEGQNITVLYTPNIENNNSNDAFVMKGDEGGNFANAVLCGAIAVLAQENPSLAQVLLKAHEATKDMRTTERKEWIRDASNVLEIAAGDIEIPHPVVVLAFFYYNRSAILSWLEAAAVQFVPA